MTDGPLSLFTCPHHLASWQVSRFLQDCIQSGPDLPLGWAVK